MLEEQKLLRTIEFPVHYGEVLNKVYVVYDNVILRNGVRIAETVSRELMAIEDALALINGLTAVEQFTQA